MKKLILFPVALILLTILISCRNQRVDERMSIAYSLLNSAPDSALSLLSHYNAKDMSGAARAYYSLIYTIAQDKSGLDVDNDSLLSYAYNYYRQHKDDSLYAKCLYYMGKYYYLNDSTKQSVDLLSEANRVAKEQGDLYTQYLALAKLSKAIMVRSPQESVEFAQKAYDVFLKHDSSNTYNKIQLLLTIGDCFYMSNQADSSLKYNKLAHSLALKLNDREVLASTFHSLSYAYRDLNALDSALMYEKMAIAYSPSPEPFYELNLSSCYVALDSVDQAESILTNLLASSFSLSPIEKYGTYHRLLELNLKKYGNNQSKIYLDSTLTCLKQLYYTSEKENASYHRDNENLKIEGSYIIQKSREQIVYFTILVVFFIVAIFALLWAIISQKRIAQFKIDLEKNKKMALEQVYKEELLRRDYEKQVEAERHQLEMEKAKYERDQQKLIVKNREKQLEIFKNYILVKLDFDSLQKQIKQENREENITHNTWLEIEVALDEIFGGFAANFRKVHPHLKEQDIHFCLLVRLGMNNYELERFYSRTNQAIKQRLLNMKSKLGIEGLEQSTREYILNFGF